MYTSIDREFKCVRVATWDQAIALGRQLKGWIHRGQRDARWGLSPTLQRAAIQEGNFSSLIVRHEAEIIEAFKAQAHHHVNQPPADEDLFEWAALLQHYGAPTRLLDFTRSFYMAAFFAFEAPTPNVDAAVWSINKVSLSMGWEKIQHQRPIEIETAASGGMMTVPYDPQLARELYKRKVLAQGFQWEARGGVRGLLHGAPRRYNERLAAQRGLFVYPSDIACDFVENFLNTFGWPVTAENAELLLTTDGEEFDSAKKYDHLIVIKIILPDRMRREALADLWQMGISTDTLFPGLDGLARSLRTRLIVAPFP